MVGITPDVYGMWHVEFRCSTGNIQRVVVNRLRKDESWPLVGVNVFCFLQCFDTVGWITEGPPACKKNPVPLIPNDPTPERVEEEYW